MKELILILSCCLFLSCEKEAKVKLPEAKPLPVMYSYICPDDTLIRLKLTSSAPLFSSNQINVLEPVPNADVKISGDQGTAQLVFNNYTGYYELKTVSYPIVAGQVYKMTVTTINGDVATAEAQVPFTTVPINAISVDAFEENYSKGDRIKVFFTDEPGAVNYYRLAVAFAFVTAFIPDTIIDDARINELYSDVGRDGESVSLDGRFYHQNDSLKYYDIYLYNCNQSYYNFQRSLRNYSGDSPFSEPTLIYSNVKGGFGCFAAYTRSRLRYKK